MNARPRTTQLVRVALALAAAGASALTACGNTVLGGGGTSGYDACDGPGQCMLVEPTCCGSCSSIGIDDVVAINQDSLTAYRTSLCGSDGTICPACAGIYDPGMYAYCGGGTCKKAHVQETSLSACVQPSDCVLRLGLGCCECGGGDWVALAASQVSSLLELVCAPGAACDLCVPVPPEGAFAECQAGHCVAGGLT